MFVILENTSRGILVEEMVGRAVFDICGNIWLIELNRSEYQK